MNSGACETTFAALETRALFVLRYKAGESGCPYHLSGEFNRDEWEWPVYVRDPFEITIVHQYEYKVTNPDSSLDFDFYGDQTYFVSDQFTALCDALEVKYRAVPLSITRNGTRISDKNHFIFLPAEHGPMLDRNSSEYEEDRDLETGEVGMNGMYPRTPIYSWIRKFVPRVGVTSDLLRCEETMGLVCSSRFKSQAEARRIKGIQFLPLRDYIYDPWGEAP